MPFLEAKAYKHLLTVLVDDVPVFETPYQVVVDDLVWFADRVEVDGLRVEAHIGDTLVSDTFSIEGPLICVTRRWSLRGRFAARVLFTVFRKMKPDRWTVPGAAYASGPGIAEAANERGPIREEAAAVPGCSAIESPDWTFAVFTQPAESIEELCSIAAHLSSELPEFNLSIPGVLPAAERPRKKKLETWDVDGQVTYERRFYVWSRPAREGGVREVLDAAREILAFEPAPLPDMSDIARAKARHIFENFFIERGDAVGFVDSVGATMFPKRALLRGGGPGGCLEAARALYRYGRATDSRELKRAALDTADFFMSHDDPGKNIFTEYRLPLRRWTAPDSEVEFHRAAGGMLAAAARLNRTAGRDANPRWLFVCKRVSEAIFDRWRRSENSGGGLELTFGKSSPADGPRTSLAFLAAAFAELSLEADDTRYLEAAEWLGGKLVPELNSGTAPALGERALERDEAHAFLRAFLLLHGKTAREEYLESAVRAADYIDSMAFLCNAPLPERSPLEQEAFVTAGGVPPAPGALWLDPYPAAIALDFLNLWKITREERLRRRAIEMLRFSTQFVAAGTRGPGVFHSFEGWQPDRFYHSGDPRSPGRWGGFSGAAPLWVPALTLGALLDISEQFPDILKLELRPIEPEKSLRRSISRAMLSLGCMVKLF